MTVDDLRVDASADRYAADQSAALTDDHLRADFLRRASGRRDERGQVTAFVVIFMAVLVLFAGLVIDGGYTLAAKRRAMNEAQAALKK